MPPVEIAGSQYFGNGRGDIILASNRVYEFQMRAIERIDHRTVHITGEYWMRPLSRRHHSTTFDIVARLPPRPRPPLKAWEEVVNAVRRGQVL